MKEKWKNKDGSQILIPSPLEDLIISLLLLLLHSQYTGFVNSSASILATVQILQCHLIYSSNTTAPATEESHSEPWWPERLVEDCCYIQDSLPLLLTFTAMSKQLPIPSVWFVDVMHGCPSYGSAARLLYPFWWVIWFPLVFLRDNFFLSHGHHLAYITR